MWEVSGLAEWLKWGSSRLTSLIISQTDWQHFTASTLTVNHQQIPRCQVKILHILAPNSLLALRRCKLPAALSLNYNISQPNHCIEGRVSIGKPRDAQCQLCSTGDGCSLLHYCQRRVLSLTRSLFIVSRNCYVNWSLHIHQVLLVGCSKVKQCVRKETPMWRATRHFQY